MSSPRRTSHLAVAAALAAATTATAPAQAQDVDGVRAECAARSAEAADECVAVALSVEAARAALGLAAAGGADLAGANSTLGKRIGSTPRFGLALRGTLLRAALPELHRDPVGDGTGWLTGVRASAAAGLFDGFSLAPTVGGILALDVVADLSLASGSGDDGFGESVAGFGAGLRLGVLRESFTLPGVTVTASRRWLGETRFGDFAAETFADPGNRGGELDTRVTSLRAVAGKDLFAVGFLAGFGWDRYEGDARLVTTVPDDASPGPVLVTPTADDLSSERLLYFGAVSFNFLVLQLNAEGGWADGIRDRGGSGQLLAGSFDLSDGSWWASASVRLTL